MCSLTTADIYVGSPVGRTYIFVRPLDFTFVYFLVLKSIYDIVSLTKRFVRLCPAALKYEPVNDKEIMRRPRVLYLASPKS